MRQYAVAAAIATAVLVWLLLAARRTHGLPDENGFDGSAPSRNLARNGLQRKGGMAAGPADALAAVCAAMRAGSSLVEAFEWQFGERFSSRMLTVGRLSALLRESCSKGKGKREQDADIRGLAGDIVAASRVSERLGCPAVRCLEAVADSYKRAKLRDRLQSQALAVPEATVRLLSALPVLALFMGESLGAQPLSFLLESTAGLVCMAIGMLCYLTGIIWVRKLREAARRSSEIGLRAGKSDG